MTFWKQGISGEIKKFFVRLRYHSLADDDSFKIGVISPELEMVLQKLWEQRYIDGYITDSDEKRTTIYLGASPDTRFITDIRFNFNKCVSLAKIRKFAKKFPHILAFVQTTNGILTFAECISFGCGGKILVLII